jgi:hypothetical protein
MAVSFIWRLGLWRSVSQLDALSVHILCFDGGLVSQFANCFMCGAWFMFGFPVYAMNKVVSRQRISLPRDEFLASVNTPDRYERPAMS